MRNSGRKDVFISHASADAEVAAAICEGLESRGVTCWIAPRDVRPGENFPSAIVRGISESPVFVLVFSQASNDSEHVARELSQAAKRGAEIVPFRVDDIEPSDGLTYYLSGTHWLNAVDGDVDAHVDALAAVVRGTGPGSGQGGAGGGRSRGRRRRTASAPRGLWAGIAFLVVAGVFVAWHLTRDERSSMPSQADLAGVWVLDDIATRRAIEERFTATPGGLVNVPEERRFDLDAQVNRVLYAPNNAHMQRITLFANGQCRHAPRHVEVPPEATSGVSIPPPDDFTACGGGGSCGDSVPVPAEAPPSAPSEVPVTPPAAAASCGGSPAPVYEEVIGPPGSWRVGTNGIDVEFEELPPLLGDYADGLLRLECSECGDVFIYRRSTQEVVAPVPAPASCGAGCG